jgi:putative FmdB family regulatory protein
VPTYQYRCSECGKSFERTETITAHEAANARCPKCNSKKVTQIPGRVHVVTSKKSYVGCRGLKRYLEQTSALTRAPD